MSAPGSKTRPPRVGDTVVFDYGAGLMVTGTVVEDRGKIGAEGRRLFRVRVETGPDVEPMFIELPGSAMSIPELRLSKHDGQAPLGALETAAALRRLVTVVMGEVESDPTNLDRRGWLDRVRLTEACEQAMAAIGEPLPPPPQPLEDP